jgi:CO/xanthine dehydrogenase FAD-binding subunit
VVAAFHPATLREALEIRAREQAVPLAGGTDLMVRLRRGAGALPAFERPVVFLDRCPELRYILFLPGDAGLEVGAMVTLAQLADSADVPAPLREALLSMGGPALRSVATIGGNICNASPAADALPFLYAYEARLRLSAAGGERELAIDSFITGPGRTVLQPHEILRSIVIPAWTPSACLWRKVGTRKANALTKVSIAAFAERRGARIRRARIALGAVAPVVLRLKEVEALLEAGRAGGTRGAVRVADAVRAAVHPIDDQRSTAEYRREVAAGLVTSFVEGLA